MTEITPSGKSRRRFLSWFLGTAAGALTVAVLYPVLRFVSPPEVPEASTNQVEAGPTNDPELLEKGFKIVRFGADPVILVRLSEDGVPRLLRVPVRTSIASSSSSKDKKRIWCNCHNGDYNLQGHSVAGPPPKPLEPVQGGPGRQGLGSTEEPSSSRGA